METVKEYESGKRVLATLPVALPVTDFPDDVDLQSITETAVGRLGSLDIGCLTDNAVWRDTFALTGTMRTFYTGKRVLKNWKSLTDDHNAFGFKAVQGSSRINRIDATTAWVEVRFTFATTSIPQTECSGFLSLVPGDEGGSLWKIGVLRTILEKLADCGDVDKMEPQLKIDGATDGVANGIHHEFQVGFQNGAQKHHFDAVVVGGGQAGLSTGGRLKALGLSYVVLERNKNNGDSWANRYKVAKRE